MGELERLDKSRCIAGPGVNETDRPYVGALLDKTQRWRVERTRLRRRPNK
jgi:hypothetical protein